VSNQTFHRLVLVLTILPISICRVPPLSSRQVVISSFERVRANVEEHRGHVLTNNKSALTLPLLLGSNESVLRLKKLLKGDRQEQTGLRKAGGETVSWEAISATVGAAWGQDGETYPISGSHIRVTIP
jgi:hypothetical protein